jgi:dCTP diphosphatase
VGAIPSPRNLTLALVGEIGELAAELQWLNDDEAAPDALDTRTLASITDEIADVAIYLRLLCSVLGLDLNKAVQSKMTRNADRFPLLQ